ncbi:MAG TPA: LUD domain-containing protein [Halobacteriales archaeon]|nr:LUD domain-containing protein [Halobacteriales archaeon]
MTTDTVSRFASSLSGVGVGLTRTTADEFAETLEAEIEPPAVGADLGIDGVSLEAAGVNTDPTNGELQSAKTGVTRAGKGIAAYGTLVLQSDAAGTEPTALYPPNHVAVLRESDVIEDVGSALSWLGEEFDAGRDSAVFATGRSATADMGELVFGVHGPVAVHVLLVTDR